MIALVYFPNFVFYYFLIQLEGTNYYDGTTFRSHQNNSTRDDVLLLF